MKLYKVIESLLVISGAGLLFDYGWQVWLGTMLLILGVILIDKRISAGL